MQPMRRGRHCVDGGSCSALTAMATNDDQAQPGVSHAYRMIVAHIAFERLSHLR
jgi:hypothetical protein